VVQKNGGATPIVSSFPVSTLIVGFSCIAVLLRRHLQKQQTTCLPDPQCLPADFYRPMPHPVGIRFTFWFMCCSCHP
jgi:hypothetical protein